jgi:hypothetical protein
MTSSPYIHRLSIISDMLESPQQETWTEAYDLLFDLWLEYSTDAAFCTEIQRQAQKHTKLKEEFILRIQQLSTSDLRKTRKLRKDLKQTLGEQSFPTIFISYAHEDEEYKDEFVTMLAILKRHGIVDTWQDRCIEPGSDWFASIQKAMTECDIAILLVSADFLASDFIQETEFVRLMQLRKEKELPVIPIIVRPCLWLSDPVLSGMQALPKDGKPIISFSQANGDRDQTWMEIGKVLEGLAKEF